MTEIIEDYHNISEDLKYDNSVTKIDYIANDQQVNINYNRNGNNIIITINPSADWLLPHKSFLCVEGQLTQADWTLYAADAQGNYPDIALTNNPFPFLFSNIKYSINEVEVENFSYPGYVTSLVICNIM